MGTPAPVFDPRAVVEGRTPGRARVGVIAGIIVAALCVLLVFGIELAEAKASGHSAAPFFIALPLALAGGRLRLGPLDLGVPLGPLY